MRNITNRSLIYLISLFVISIVIVPLLYLTTISLSSINESTRYPKELLPTFNNEFIVDWDEENMYYYIQLVKPDGNIEDLYYSARFDRISNYFEVYLNIDVTPERLESDFTPARTNNEVLNLTYNKNILKNYIKFFQVFEGAQQALINSVQAALLTILISLTLGGSVGYALARTNIKGKDSISLVTLIVRMFPAISISVPLAILLIRYGLFDSLIGIAAVYSIPNIGLTAWITRSIFISVNKEFEEASLVFGATKLQTFAKITLPLVIPAFAASSMYAFITAWNDTAVALLLTNNNQTLALLVYKSIGGSSALTYAAAGAVLLILPALVFTFFMKNYISKIWG